MRRLLPLLALSMMLPSFAEARFGNFPAADRVLGATGFNVAGDGAAGASGMDEPTGIAIDPTSGKSFVAVATQNRVLRFANATSLASGANAEAVLGQINLSGTSAGTTQTTMEYPLAVAVDGQGRLWVADTGNHRILRFDGAATLANGAPADRVLGQAGLASKVAGVSPRTLSGPYGNPGFDAGGALWLCDGDNNRVLRFSPDRIRPKLRVTTRVPARTSSARLALAGKASDTTSGIVSVEIRVNKRPSRPAAGTTSWRAKAKLDRGATRISLSATDGAGNLSAPRRLRVTRGG